MKPNTDKALAKKIPSVANSLPKMQRIGASTSIDKTTNETQLKENIMEIEPLQGKLEPIQEESNNTGLPDNLKTGIENLSGYSMNDVKVNYNSAQPAQLNANTYTQGTDIPVAPGQDKHLPHEAWHVEQQKQGSVKPTLQMKEGIPVNNDAGQEK